METDDERSRMIAVRRVKELSIEEILKELEELKNTGEKPLRILVPSIERRRHGENSVSWQKRSRVGDRENQDSK